MKTIAFCAMAALSLCAICGNLFAQTDACYECYCAADNTCTTDGGCGQDAGCGGSEFTANCGGNYTVRVVVTCSSGSVCDHCYGCAWIADENGDTMWESIAQTSCEPNGCEETSPEVSLSSAGKYKLYVCLRACEGNCIDCTSCTVRGWVRNHPAATCQACNP